MLSVLERKSLVNGTNVGKLIKKVGIDKHDKKQKMKPLRRSETCCALDFQFSICLYHCITLKFPKLARIT